MNKDSPDRPYFDLAKLCAEAATRAILVELINAWRMVHPDGRPGRDGSAGSSRRHGVLGDPLVESGPRPDKKLVAEASGRLELVVNRYLAPPSGEHPLAGIVKAQAGASDRQPAARVGGGPGGPSSGQRKNPRAGKTGSANERANTAVVCNTAVGLVFDVNEFGMPVRVHGTLSNDRIAAIGLSHEQRGADYSSAQRSDKNEAGKLYGGEDDAFHVIAFSLGGPPDHFNLIPMGIPENRRSGWRDFEEEMRQLAIKGYVVEVDFHIRYRAHGDRTSRQRARPVEIAAHYSARAAKGAKGVAETKEGGRLVGTKGVLTEQTARQYGVWFPEPGNRDRG